MALLTQKLISRLNLETRANIVFEKLSDSVALIQQRDPRVYLEDLIGFGSPDRANIPKLGITDYIQLPARATILKDYILRLSFHAEYHARSRSNYSLAMTGRGIVSSTSKVYGYSVRALFTSIEGILYSLNADIGLPFKGQIKLDVQELASVIGEYLEGFKKQMPPNSHQFGSYFIKEGVKIDYVALSQMREESGKSISLMDAKNTKVYAELIELEDKHPVPFTSSAVIADLSDNISPPPSRDFSLKMADSALRGLIPKVVVINRKFEYTIFGDRNRTIHDIERDPQQKSSRLYCRDK